MRILIVSQYFWPENFRINDLCLGLRDRGHEVVILTGNPNYPQGDFYEGYSFFSKRKEIWQGITIHRAALISRGRGSGVRLFLNYFSFAFFASLRVLFISSKFDKIFVYEPSPITVGIPAIIAKLKFRAPIFFWVQDLWPESISAAGGVNNRFVLKCLDLLTRFIYRNSEIILVQSQAFKSYIIKQGINEGKLVYFPNSTEDHYMVVQRNEEYHRTLPKGFRLMFAGNIGKSQSFDTLLEAALMLKNASIQVNWIVLGDGRMREYVENKIRNLHLENTFFMIGSFPSTEMSFYFSCADALLVSLQSDRIFSLTIPSKVQSYMACGKPIIGALSGEGARVIIEANAGFVSASENYVELANNIRKMVKLSEAERNLMGQNARDYFEKEFERNNLLEKLEVIFQKH